MYSRTQGEFWRLLLQDTPETLQVVHGLENVLRVVEMQTEIQHGRIQSTHTHIQKTLWESGAKLV